MTESHKDEYFLESLLLFSIKKPFLNHTKANTGRFVLSSSIEWHKYQSAQDF